MSPAYYQSMLSRSWRRSGSLLYRPNQRDSCCPHYTLRLDSSEFRATKDQRQAINRFNKHVTGDTYAKEAARRYPRSREESNKRDVEFDLVERIHEAETQSLKQPPKPSHAFSVTLESDEFTEEKYAVFENYQRVVHEEAPSSISRDGFRRFLCSSPLRRETLTVADGSERQLGSFHHCYRLDGKLFAIGVLDLLPDCVSAVYFLYDESVHQFSPGKLGALREIALAKEKGYRWWYSGFYIHTCPKMRYKIDYSPQYILNPDTLVWERLDKDALALFDSKGYLHVEKLRQQDEKAVPPNVESTHAEGELSEPSDAEGEDSDEDQSLFYCNMPGIPSLEAMASVDLDQILVRLSRGFCAAGVLFDWDDERMDDPASAKGMVSEIVAAVGPELMPQACLDFRKS
ncbi:arginine-tRNA-protein transferase [Pseudomassariella vexata]|uniref:arginyltransferase n=1 Tax=Pseudomassariella vexata TaxID=1141098 RepID=A0A1Y2DYU0_9PEZI|nr:arginine-tRNA-protein transferase [Pseudomassariella vexata]ORY64379.1 arginine-tRNA-protein transferase [Pseudomassariella vexata]